jgi:hypothetical protein
MERVPHFEFISASKAANPAYYLCMALCVSEFGYVTPWHWNPTMDRLNALLPGE